jgi:hypothetical protein
MEKLLAFLNKFNYKYELKNNKTIIFIDNSFVMEVLFENEKIIICDKFINWSPVSGYFKGNLRKSLIMFTVALVVTFVILEMLKIFYFENDYTYLLLITLAYSYSWFFYYLIKFESLKLKIETILYDKN